MRNLSQCLPRNTRYAGWMLLLLFGLSGCAANQSKTASVDDNALYEGRSTVSFSNLPVAKTPEEGVALGDQQLRAGEYDKALYLYIQAMQLDDDNTEALYKIGRIHMERGNTGKAVMAFEGVLARDLQHIRGNEALGVLYLKNNRYDQARQFFQRAVQGDQARLKAAGDAASEAIAYDAQSPAQAFNGLGVLADLDGEHAQAQAHYATALAIQPASTLIWNNRGYSYYLSKEWDAAERAYKTALRYDAKSHQVWKNLGLLYARQEHYLKALMAFEQVMDTANAHNDIGYICMLEGKYDKAEYYFEQAMSHSPTFYKKAHDNMTQTKRLREQLVTQR